MTFDWEGAASDEAYAEHLKTARDRFLRGQTGTVQDVKDVYRRASVSIRDDINDATTGPLHRRHLRRLLDSLNDRVRQINAQTLAATRAGVRLAIDDALSGPESIAIDLLQDRFRREGVERLFSDLNERAVLSFLGRSRYGDGLKLSDRVYRIGDHVRSHIATVIEDGVARGQNSRTLARRLQRYIAPDVWSALKAETRQNLGVAKDVSHEAMRLAVTETNNAYHEATINGSQAVPSYRGVYWRLSGQHQIEDVCDDYASHNGDGLWPKGEEPTKPHPWCKCVILPAMEDPDEFKDRLVEWVADPGSQPDLEEWYNTTARQFLKRPNLQVPTITADVSDPEFVTEAVNNGLTREAALAVDRMGSDLARRTSDEGFELAAMIDDRGQQLGRILRGSDHEIRINEHLQSTRPGRQYVQVHTHPTDSAFSAQDAAIISESDEVTSMVVYGADQRTKYVLSQARPRVATKEEIVAAYERERKALHDKYSIQVVTKKKTRYEAWKEHSHEIWENIADELGFNYTRVEGS